MAGIAGDIALVHQPGFLFKFGIKFRLHARVVRVLGPADEMLHGPLGAVGVEDHEPIAHLPEFVRRRLELLRRLHGQDGVRRFVTVDHIPHKIVGARVADIQNHVLDHFMHVAEAVRQPVGRFGGSAKRQQAQQGGDHRRFNAPRHR